MFELNNMSNVKCVLVNVFHWNDNNCRLTQLKIKVFEQQPTGGHRRTTKDTPVTAATMRMQMNI